MSHLIDLAGGGVVDVDTPRGQYEYIARELCKFGAASSVLSMLERLYGSTKRHPDPLAEAMADALEMCIKHDCLGCVTGGSARLALKYFREATK